MDLAKFEFKIAEIDLNKKFYYSFFNNQNTAKDLRKESLDKFIDLCEKEILVLKEFRQSFK